MTLRPVDEVPGKAEFRVWFGRAVEHEVRVLLIRDSRIDGGAEKAEVDFRARLRADVPAAARPERAVVGIERIIAVVNGAHVHGQQRIPAFATEFRALDGWPPDGERGEGRSAVELFAPQASRNIVGDVDDWLAEAGGLLRGGRRDGEREEQGTRRAGAHE